MRDRLWKFIDQARLGGFPAGTLSQAKRCLLDLVGVAAAGRSTELSKIIYGHAALLFGAGLDQPKSNLWFDGTRVSPAGAALAGGMTIDAMDAHDGDPLCKGHIGCGLVPSLIALAQNTPNLTGEEFLNLIIAGYEIGARAGITLHATAADYHTSGAWIAPTVACIGSHMLGLDQDRAMHAIGIADYHGPRSPMMRAIDHPTMVKDGSGWGAMTGVSACYLAASGFTGAPALTFENPAFAIHWESLGQEWRIMEQYFKPYPVCRWAQPAIAAILALKREHHFQAVEISQIEITTFHEAKRLAGSNPVTTEEAQYALSFPLAVAAIYGDITPAMIDGEGLQDEQVLALAQRIKLRESEKYNQLFPAKRLADAQVNLKNGQALRTGPMIANGEAKTPLSDEQIGQKFTNYAQPLLGAEQTEHLRQTILTLDRAPNLNEFLAALTSPR